MPAGEPIVIEIEFVSADGSNHQSASGELRHASQRKSRPSGAGPANSLTTAARQLPTSYRYQALTLPMNDAFVRDCTYLSSLVGNDTVSARRDDYNSVCVCPVLPM
jgi:hypothetical protein